MIIDHKNPEFYLRASPATSADGADYCVVASRTLYPSPQEARTALEAVLQTDPSAATPLELKVTVEVTGTSRVTGFRIVSAGAAETLAVAMQVSALHAAALRLTRPEHRLAA